jgi:hypothetical protein
MLGPVGYRRFDDIAESLELLVNAVAEAQQRSETLVGAS